MMRPTQLSTGGAVLMPDWRAWWGQRKSIEVVAHISFHVLCPADIGGALDKQTLAVKTGRKIQYTVYTVHVTSRKLVPQPQCGSAQYCGLQLSEAPCCGKTCCGRAGWRYALGNQGTVQVAGSLFGWWHCRADGGVVAWHLSRLAGLRVLLPWQV